MNVSKSILAIILIFSLANCRQATDTNEVIKKLQLNFEKGDFTRLSELADSLSKNSPEDTISNNLADSLNQIAERIIVDFPLSEQETFKLLEERIPGFTPDQKAIYEQKGWLEWRLINGQKMYFNRAVSNLLLLKSFYEQKEIRNRAIAGDKRMIFRAQHTKHVVSESNRESTPAVPVRMKI